jgi:Fur family ferric uptake transcriptional regulator/Fur family peroxide stress response transcriptional regulator
MTDYTALLKASDLKATFQRMNILSVFDRYGHMSVDDIYAEVIKVHPSLSLATIYKNIILMVEKGVLVEVPIAGRKSKYELSKADHIHLVCTECGMVEDRQCVDEAEMVFETLSEQEHFKLNKRQVNLYGVFEACQTQKAS